MVSSRVLATRREDCNPATAREGISDGGLACVTIICQCYTCGWDL
jgi:hypothetical protein